MTNIGSPLYLYITKGELLSIDINKTYKNDNSWSADTITSKMDSISRCYYLPTKDCVCTV